MLASRAATCRSNERSPAGVRTVFAGEDVGRAVAVGLECLRHVGIDWSAHPTADEARQNTSVSGRARRRAIEDLVDLPSW